MNIVKYLNCGPEVEKMGLVAQTVQSSIVITGEQWIARTPPKRQVEGSNPSEPAKI
jgi:hypothetical protein